ncbi:YfhO family protein [Chitinophaga japonensis]|uniref:Membrane protein YfhO n=1 Tax=Chitinophaga japonensis TaxID=104662 RepID=A0A562T1X3_CHIJA|nr:YfhO family protein [Chitinophaga japonensis]TWI86876.1 membrane protein YfhO [Chitinophaga japonensis]
MKNNWLKALLPHVIAVVALLILTILYCKPALDGKVLSQSDVLQWQGMAKESLDYKEEHGITPLWTTSMFGGMPTYQMAMEGRYKISTIIPAILTFGLPKPINVLFLAAACFYLLCVILGARPWVAFMGAVAFTYASYSPIIVSTGHDSKMMAMAYMPAVVAGIVLITKRKYVLGAAVTALALTYLIAANHLQVTYYFFLLLGVVAVAYIVYCIREKEIKHLLIGAGVTIGAVLLGIGSNALTLWTTYEYSHASNRGGTSELSPLPGQEATRSTGGLDKDYAFQWSYGKLETLTLLAPNIYGGSSSGDLSTSSETYKELTNIGVPAAQAEQMIQRWPLYWGDQSLLGTSGPVYLGVVICLLAVLALFIVRSWHKWWLVGITVLAILMAWGSNFASFNYFLFDHLPFYNKFRAPSQALIIPQLTFAILAVMGLNELVNGQLPKAELFKKLKWTGMGIGGILVLLLLLSGSLSYTNYSNDPERPGTDNQFQAQLTQMTQGNTAVVDGLMKALREDREALYRNDVLRSLVLAGLAFGLLWFFLKGRLKAEWMTAGIVVLVLFDLLQVDRRYLSTDDFLDPLSYGNVFQPSAADQQILQDKDPYYRVYNLTAPGGPFNDAMTSYFHKSVGGYHAAKLQLYVDLIERQISKNNMQVLNMLNTKYIIQAGPDGQPVVRRNPGALGNAWFVKQIQWAPDADAEMKALDSLNPAETVVIDQRFKPEVKGEPVYDSAATIRLIANNLNTISYEYNAATPQFAVFSEIYYKKGWKAFIDGQETPYARVNYALRGMMVPAGKHTIEFRFEPVAYYLGDKIGLVSYIIMLGLLVSGIVINIRKRKKSALA